MERRVSFSKEGPLPPPTGTSAFDPLRTFGRAVQNGLMKVLLLVPFLLSSAACGALNKSSAEDLTDGCYFLDGTPVLRVQGSRGELLIPGDVKETRLRQTQRDGGTEVIFEPGFRVQLRPELRAVSPPDLPQPRIYLPMKAWASAATIGVHTSPELGVVDLVHGGPC
jgi:hypothetical protein